MNEIVKILSYSIDLDAPIEKTPLATLFATEDDQAHRFELTLHRGGAAVDLTSAAVTAYFIRHADRVTVPLTGSIEDGKAVVTLTDACYALAGMFALVIKVALDDVRATVFYGEGGMTRSRTDSIIDEGNVIPSLDELLAQIKVMDEAIADAQTAADQAETAAANADAAAAMANTAAQEASDAADAAEGWANATASVEMLEADAEPSVSLETGEDGSKIIRMKLPRGETGATPEITFTVSTGEPGTEATLEQSGTAENPVIHLTIPRGDTGKIDGLTLSDAAPAALGEASAGESELPARGDHIHPMPTAEDIGARPDTWTPTASDVGALASDGTAADSAKLGGTDAAQYAKIDNLPTFTLDGTTLYIETTQE